MNKEILLSKVFNLFANKSVEGLGIADTEGRIIYVNPALCKLIG
jgi:PAS domain S-box-containing protein